jgi:hypothetical protein
MHAMFQYLLSKKGHLVVGNARLYVQVAQMMGLVLPAIYFNAILKVVLE